jgi:S-layer protein
VNSAASAVTLTGGDGVDTFDVSGFKAANAGAAVTITDLAKGEVIKFVSAASADFVSSKVTLIAEATFNDYVTEATKAADIAADLAGGGTGVAGLSWFQFNGNTFIVQDVDGNGAFTNGTDIVVKLTGLIDLSGASFNDVTAGSLKYL